MELLKDLYEDFGAIGCSVFIIGALAIYCLMYFGIGYCVLSLLSVFNPIEITFEKSASAGALLFFVEALLSRGAK